MIYDSILHTRNIAIISLFFIGSLVHLLLMPVFPQEFAVSTPYYCLLYGAIVYFICFKRNSTQLTMWLLMIGINLAIFHINLTAPLFAHFLLFVMPFILAGIYNCIQLNLTLLCLTMVESMFVFFTYKEQYLTSIRREEFLAIFITICFIILVTFVNVLLRKSAWENLWKEQDTIKNTYTSKQNFLRLFIEHTNDAIAIFDLDDSILEVNPAFEKMYGWSREECIGKKDLPLFPDSRLEEVKRRSRMVRKGEHFQMLEVIDRKRDGTLMDVQLTLNPIFNERGDVIATSMIARDISFKVERERLTIEAEKLKAAGEMAAGVAHEVRNPMTVISGFVQMMNDDPDNPYKEYTNVLESELKRIDQIISEYLILAKPQASTQQQLNIHHLLNEVMILFGPEMNNRQIAVTVHSEASKTEILGEENLLKQLFINLIKNAMEAVSQEGLIQIIIENPNDQNVTIRIKDNGIGMSNDVISKVFEPFYTTKENGTGLGMMISKKIISDHGGNISLESEEGVGTTFSVKLPVVIDAENPNKECLVGL